MNMWNSLDLPCPIKDVVEYPPQDHYILENLRDFVTVLTTAADTLTCESPLWSEMKILNNIQVKYRRILRCDRFLVFLQRVAHCLRKMVLLNLSKSYLNLAERFLVGFQDISGTASLPSRQQVEYILIRTLSASRLVCEAISHSRDSFCYLIQKIKVGHLILDLIMATSIVARLNILLRATLEQLCSIYKKVLFWRYKVKRGKFEWAEKIDFPQDVSEWIKRFEPACLKPLSMSKKDIDRVKSMVMQTNRINSVIEVSDTDSVVLVNEIKQDSLEPDIMMETDYGEVITRENSETNQNLEQKKKVKSSSKSLEKKRVESALKLIDKKSIESPLKLIDKKSIDSNRCLTRMQKVTLQKIVEVQSLKSLEDLWSVIRGLSNDHFPRALTKKRKGTIDKLLARIKAIYPDKKFKKTFEANPSFLNTAIIHFSEKLGYTKDFIIKPSEETKFGVSTQLGPVKTVKKLRLLYKQLKEILKLSNQSEKLRLLTTIYKHRIIDIRHLKVEGKRELAKQLTSCTSKEFLALYR